MPPPRRGEGRVSAGTATADPSLLQIVGKVPALLDQRQDLGREEVGVPRIKGVVLGVPVLRLVRRVEDARVNEDPDHRGDLAGVDEIVQHDAPAHIAFGVEVPPAVVEHHHGRGCRRIHPVRHVHPHSPACAWIAGAVIERQFRGDASGHVAADE